MNDDAHDLIDRALPSGRVPFTVDSAEIATTGRGGARCGRPGRGTDSGAEPRPGPGREGHLERLPVHRESVGAERTGTRSPHGEGWFESEGHDIHTGVTVAVCEPGLADSLDEFVDCQGDRVACEQRNGAGESRILTRQRDTKSGAATIRELAIYVHRADASIVKIVAKPEVDDASAPSGTVSPIIGTDRLTNVALAVPGDLDI